MSAKLSGEVVKFIANCVNPAPKHAVIPSHVPAPGNVPNVEGTYAKSIKCLRVERGVELPLTMMDDYLMDYEFNYSQENLETSINNRIIIRQDEKNPKFGLIYEDVLQNSLKPASGLRPFVITRGSNNNWLLISVDYDDNGKIELEIITDDDNNVVRLDGHYTESGYDSVSVIQVPTVGTITCKKISSTIELRPNNMSNEPKMYDIAKLYFNTISLLPLDTKWNGLDENDALDYYVNRNDYATEQILPKYYASLVKFANLEWTPTNAVKCNGVFMDKTQTHIIGRSTSIKCFRTLDGITDCVSMVGKELFDREDWVAKGCDISSKKCERGLITRSEYSSFIQRYHQVGGNTAEVLYQNILAKGDSCANLRVSINALSNMGATVKINFNK